MARTRLRSARLGGCSRPPTSTTITVSVFSVGAGGALTQVTGSPFATGQPCGGDCGPIAVAFSPDGKLLATANFCGDSVSVFSVGAGGALTPVAGSPFPAGDRARSRSRLARTGSCSRPQTRYRTTMTVSVFSVGADGALTQVPGSPFATGTEPSRLRSARMGACSRPQIVEHGVGVLGRRGRRAHPGRRLAVHDRIASVSVAFSPDGSLLATANTGGNVSVFSVGAGGALTPVAGSPFPTGNRIAGSEPFSVAFSPDGSLLATANEAAGPCRCSRSARAACSPRSSARRSRLVRHHSTSRWRSVRPGGCSRPQTGPAPQRRVDVLARVPDQGRAAVGVDQLAG